MAWAWPALAQDSSSDFRKRQVDSVLVINGKKLVVSQKVWNIAGNSGSFGRTLRAYQLKNATGDTLFSRGFTAPEVTEHGFTDAHEIFLSVVSTPRRQALLVYTAGYPSAPNTGIDMQLFVWNADSLIPLGPPFDIYGDFGTFRRQVPGESVTLGSSEVELITHHANHHFYLDIPLVINLNPDTAKHFRTALEKDPQSGLVIIPVSAERRISFMDEHPVGIQLYTSPTGSERETVSINKTSKIRIAEAYGSASIGRSEKGIWVSFEVQRLKVKINGRVGFVERQDYRKLGLPAFG